MQRSTRSRIKPKSSRVPKPQKVFRFAAIGTDWTIEIYQSITSLSAKTVLADIKKRIELFDKHYSRFRSDSLVTEMSQKSGKYKLPPDAKILLDTYQELYALTGGSVTPLIGQLLSDAGYDADYSLKTEILRPVQKWQEALDYKFPWLVVKQQVLLDFGAAGKGYLVDIIGALLLDAGITSYCINAGGDILQRSEPSQPLAIGLENPDNFNQVIGIASLANQSLCGSAGNRRAWGKLHHIMNPLTLVSANHLKAVWVTAENAILADALATCLFFVTPTKLNRYTFEYAIIYEDSTLEHSEHFPARFFTTPTKA